MNVGNLGYSKKTKSDHKSSNSQIRCMCKNQLYFDINVVYVIEKRSSLSAANRATHSKWDVCKIDFRLSNTYPKLSHLAKTFDFVRRLSTKTNIVKKALLLTG